MDDMVAATVAANLATSQGYMGEEAIARSTRADRSRDGLYNLLKMHAEVFRTLGLLHPTPESSLKFTFTLLGEQLVAAGSDFWPLIQECMLGIIYPTPTLAIKGDFDLRPIAFILRVMAACDGHLSKDEMIIGPLCARSDRDSSDLASVATQIRSIRTNKAATKAALQQVSDQREIQVNTLYNYTRLPIALLRDSGLTSKGRASFSDGKSYETWYLTDEGRALVDRISHSVDVRPDDIQSLTPEERRALAFVSHFAMLERAGFDVDPVRHRIAEAEEVTRRIYKLSITDRQNILFSPFQSLPLDECAKCFPPAVSLTSIDETYVVREGAPDGRNDRAHLFSSPMLVAAPAISRPGADRLREELSALIAAHHTPSSAAHAFVEAHAQDTQIEFYPLVTHLFHLLGFASECSRAGVNYQRWDACVWINDLAVPVEIKSPTEEVVLSTKAVRQALENKVTLLSRGGLKTTRDLTSLVVGNKLPNERGDMSNLIDDVFNAYGLRLGVLDLYTLAYLAIRAITDGVTLDPVQLSELRGFLNV